MEFLVARSRRSVGMAPLVAASDVGKISPRGVDIWSIDHESMRS